MDLIQKTVEASTSFENADRKLKKEYLLKNINTFKKVTEVLPGFRGAFGLGYPFYALGKDLEGELPYIKEQIRYNNKLLDEFLDNSYDNVWHCEKCLQANMDNMPDLKKVCYKCPVVPKKIKPRKVINRLPDMDFCLVVEDGYEEVSKIKLLDIFDKNGFYTSDVNPLKTINDVYEISEDLKKGEMPSKFVPIDVHLFSYEELYMLIEKVGEVIQLAEENGIKAYLPTLPDSLRKTWQHDDQAINFVFDYLFSMTEYKFESNLFKKLQESRKEIATQYGNDVLERIMLETCPPSLPKRYENLVLQKRFNERMNLWREL